MAKDQKEKKVTVVAELAVVSGEGLAHTIKTFDRAWHLALELPGPVHVTHIGWVRKD